MDGFHRRHTPGQPLTAPPTTTTALSLLQAFLGPPQQHPVLSTPNTSMPVNVTRYQAPGTLHASIGIPGIAPMATPPATTPVPPFPARLNDRVDPHFVAHPLHPPPLPGLAFEMAPTPLGATFQPLAVANNAMFPVFASDTYPFMAADPRPMGIPQPDPRAASLGIAHQQPPAHIAFSSLNPGSSAAAPAAGSWDPTPLIFPAADPAPRFASLGRAPEHLTAAPQRFSDLPNPFGANTVPPPTPVPINREPSALAAIFSPQLPSSTPATHLHTPPSSTIAPSAQLAAHPRDFPIIKPDPGTPASTQSPPDQLLLVHPVLLGDAQPIRRVKRRKAGSAVVAGLPTVGGPAGPPASMTFSWRLGDPGGLGSSDAWGEHVGAAVAGLDGSETREAASSASPPLTPPPGPKQGSLEEAAVFSAPHRSASCPVPTTSGPVPTLAQAQTSPTPPPPTHTASPRAVSSSPDAASTPPPPTSAGPGPSTTSQGKHACPHAGCTARFRRRAHLLSHTLRHTREKSYTCDLCDPPVPFGRLHDLRRHERTKHVAVAPTTPPAGAVVLPTPPPLAFVVESPGGSPGATPTVGGGGGDAAADDVLELLASIGGSTLAVAGAGAKRFACVVCGTAFTRADSLKKHRDRVCGVGPRSARRKRRMDEARAVRRAARGEEGEERQKVEEEKEEEEDVTG
ncbi:hypothetical protein HDU96_002033 [Phlyctochytrium bullatum]|nr:hypothetical protein HDU96_002033 [Phlyctochytrium bullatum]